MTQPPPAEFTAHDLHCEGTVSAPWQMAAQGVAQPPEQRQETRFM
jgi:hypothetical protein